MTASYYAFQGFEEGGEASFPWDDVYDALVLSSDPDPVHTGDYALRLSFRAGEENIGEHLHLHYDEAWTNCELSRRSARTGERDPSLSFYLNMADFYEEDDAFKIAFMMGTSEAVTFVWNATSHSFDVSVDGTAVASGSVVVPSAWAHVEVQITEEEGYLSIGMKIDDALSIDVGSTSAPAGYYTTQITTVMFKVEDGLAVDNGTSLYIDDVALGAADWLGDVRVAALPLNGDFLLFEWEDSPDQGPGNNYLSLNDPLSGYLYSDCAAFGEAQFQVANYTEGGQLLGVQITAITSITSPGNGGLAIGALVDGSPEAVEFDLSGLDAIGRVEFGMMGTWKGNWTETDLNNALLYMDNRYVE